MRKFKKRVKNIIPKKKLIPKRAHILLPGKSYSYKINSEIELKKKTKLINQAKKKSISNASSRGALQFFNLTLTIIEN